MAKLLLVLFLAGCISNISHSRLIPLSSDSDPQDSNYPTILEDDNVPELKQEYHSDSVTEIFEEPKKVVKRRTNNTAPDSDSPAGERPMSLNSTAVSDFERTVNTIVNITDTVTEVIKQLGDFNELVFGVFETLGRFGRAAPDLEDPSDDVDLISDIGAEEKRDGFLKNPVDDVFGRQWGNREHGDSENKLERDEPLEDILPTSEKIEDFFNQLEAKVDDILRGIEAEEIRTNV